ncbi:MAG: type II toxin-antitoxin system PemK/MazF family toxin [Bryobacteraceae bacterium]|jgi:mRNA interferase MazF
MVISQGEIWWADLPAPAGSGPGFRRPVIVGERSWKCPIRSGLSGLPKDSVANVSQIVALDRDLTERVGKLPRGKILLILAGIDTVLGK